MNQHEPEDQFVDHLEWQLATALRRKQRFARPASGRALRMARTAALVTICLIGGAGIVVGAQHLQQSRASVLLLAKNSVQIDTAKLQIELEMRRLATIETLWKDGIVGPRELSAARLEARNAEFTLQRLELDREEMNASGEAPNAQVSAPLVRRRDYLSEGLRLEREVAITRSEHLSRDLALAKNLYESGHLSYLEMLQARQPSLMFEHDIHAFDELLKLRAEFLTGQHDAQTTELLHLRINAQKAMMRAQQSIEVNHARLEIIQAQVNSGIATQTELMEYESALLRAEGELELHRLELALIDERLGR